MDWSGFVDQVLIVDKCSVNGRDPETVVRACMLGRKVEELSRPLAYVCYHIASMLDDFPFEWCCVVAACGRDPSLNQLKDKVLKLWKYSVPLWRKEDTFSDVRDHCLQIA